MDRCVSNEKVHRIVKSVETMIKGGMNADKAVELARDSFALSDEDVKLLIAELRERGMKDIFESKHF